MMKSTAELETLKDLFLNRNDKPKMVLMSSKDIRVKLNLKNYQCGAYGIYKDQYNFVLNEELIQFGQQPIPASNAKSNTKQDYLDECEYYFLSYGLLIAAKIIHELGHMAFKMLGWSHLQQTQGSTPAG
ncbi:unnamed protein product, partial [Didymodactylos carnosus]